MTQIPFIPETAPFTPEPRAWLNGFLAGLFSNQSPGHAKPEFNGAVQKNAEPLLVLFGSQTGSAEGLAKRAAKEAQQRGFAPKIMALNDYEQANLVAGGKAIIISSTWGDGDPPDNAVNFWSWLNSETAPRLEQLQFAVLGLGDKNYSDFCGASKKFDSRLEALGARRLLARGECDVDYDSAATKWMDGLWNEIALGTGQAPVIPSPSKNGSTNGTPSSNGSHGRPAAAYDRTNPFPTRLLKNVLLNKPGSAKEVRHYEIDLTGSGLAYEVGDALGLERGIQSVLGHLVLGDDGREAGPIERAEKFLRAVRHEDDADDDAGDKQRPINGRTITNCSLRCHNFSSFCRLGAHDRNDLRGTLLITMC